MAESSTKPYFIRALHEWCTDNGYTPHVVVQVDESTHVPRAFISDGQITLNVGLLATNQLDLNNEFISFQARFGGKTEDVWVPISAVSAIFARETGAGMGFDVGDSNEGFSGASDEAHDEPSAETNKHLTNRTNSHVGEKVTGAPTHNATDNSPHDETPPPKRLHLSIVK